jgi:ATP-binding cassette, subfamily B, multidrug efflux pump
MFSRFFSWLERYVDSFPLETAERPPSGLLPFIVFYSKPFVPLLAASVLLSIALAGLEVYFFGFIGRLVDTLSSGDRATFWQVHGREMAVMGGLVLVVIPLLNFVSEAVSHQGLRGGYAMRTRWLAHRYVLRQSMDFFHNDFAGRVATKVMQAALGVRDAVMKVTEVLTYVVVYFVSALILAASSDWRLTLPILLWFTGYAVACRYFVPRMEKLSTLQADMRSMVTGRVVDSYTNISTVKLFAHADREDRFAREGMERMLDAVNKSMRMATGMTSTLGILNGVLMFTMLGVSVWLWLQSSISTGAIAVALALAMRFKAMSQWIIWEVAGMFEDIGVIKDSIETISRDRYVADAPGAKPLIMAQGNIVFENVTFNYGKPAQSEKVLDGLSLRVRPGEKVGLVGRSGAGKSTLTNLLLRFYDVEGGRIVIDGQDIAKVTQDSLRANIGMVTQDTSLLHRAVIDNLRYGKPDATMADVEAAAAKAHADEFIAKLVDPDGRTAYDAHVGERGVKLSGGQRQRVAIARVLLKNAPILILDEATSALDSEVEAAIQENLYTLMEGKTVIAVAHRLSTIAAMDRLVVMDKGVIVEEGTHKQLLTRNGLYARLWQRQSGGFLVDDVAAAAE